MRHSVVLGIIFGFVVGFGMNGASPALGEVSLPIETCMKLAEQKDAMDNSDIRQFLAMNPATVRAQHGQLVVERVRNYISLSEKVLFQCPPNVLNRTALSLEGDADEVPPLPAKGPKRARIELPRGTLVPLPTKRDGRLFRFPTSPG
jgi:hypothetical protein